MPHGAEILELLILTVCLIMTALARLNGFHAGLYLNATIALTVTLSQKPNGKVRSSRNAKLRKTYLQEKRETFFAARNSMAHARCKDYIWKSDEIKTTGLWSVFGSQRMCVAVFPATPVFADPQLQPPDVACVFPEMRYEDSRVGSFSGGQNDRVNQSALRLAGNGYYYDDIYQDIRCFYCGLTYDGHLPHCRERRERCNVPFRHCWRHREQRVVCEDDNLVAIISSPGFVLRDQEVSRGLTRETQHRQAVGLISGQCPSCSRDLSHDVVFSSNHRARRCERCYRLQDACPYCGQGTSDNPTMAEYNRRTTLQLPRDPRTCLVCRDTHASIRLMPCNHIVVCAQCSRTIRFRFCPICFSNIEQVVETLESL